MALAVPLFALGLLSKDIVQATVFLGLANVALSGWAAPSFAMLYRLTSSRTRATAVAMFYMIINLVGLGVGPPFTGLISDTVSRVRFAGDYIQQCNEPVGQVVQSCSSAASTGLMAGLGASSILLLIAAVFYWRAGRLIRGR